jgi:F-type H+-transporting ATPase subunit alpha
MLFAGTQGYLDQFQVSEIRAFEDGLYPYLESGQTALMEDLTKKRQLDDDIKGRLHAALKEYSENFKSSQSDKDKK